MPAVAPHKLSTIAEVGDTLTLGTFLRPGSPAPEKEPFFAFYKESDPHQAVCLRNCTVVLVSCPSLVFDGLQAVYLIYTIDPKTLRKTKDGRFVFFPNSLKEMAIEKGRLPQRLRIHVLTPGSL